MKHILIFFIIIYTQPVQAARKYATSNDPRQTYLNLCKAGLQKPQNLYDAVLVHNIEAIQHFIDTKADLNWQNNDGITPLILAAHQENLKSIQLLLTAGAKVHLQNNENQNVLDYILYSYLVNISAKKTLGLAINHDGLFQALRLLVKAGARPSQPFIKLCSVSVERTLTKSWPYIPGSTKLLITSLYNLDLATYVTKEEITEGCQQAWPYLCDGVKAQLLTTCDVSTDGLPADHITLSIPMPNYIKPKKEKEWKLCMLTTLSGLTPPQGTITK